MTYKVVLSSVSVLAALVGVGISTVGVANAQSNLPAATSTKQNDASGSVSGKSDATVKVEQGYLTLDAVPDMNFGMTAQTKTANKNIPLVSNAGLIDDDGNDSGMLKVTDSRGTDDGKTVTTMPWNLTAQLGSFSSASGAALTSSSDWAIHLNQTAGTNSVSAANMPAVYQPVLTSGDNAEHQVLKSSQGNGTGSTTVYYNKANDASLDMGANVPAGQYDAPITWTLNATPTSASN
ncbi:conserved protein [Weissella oryzae SG25]|uniref:Conserved protein n=1 Tax=Weissella oryzae (strain DSM 25784 / JCM 18191 / LMG 30913 / SG25) TaxID=1329250 RepID=A0A069CWS4_WEIOS|nr:WxL domain-containing protein [Weissella oryzae]GAK31802.1 conserved protein [Weissella oryzae SG25]